MSQQGFDTSSIADIDAFIEANWDSYLDDLDSLVRIPSTESKVRAVENAPWGPGPRSALSEMLHIADRMGFETCDLEGYLGYAQFSAECPDQDKIAAGKRIPQIGIIGHVDVVPDGPGWNFMPYQLTKKDGYLIGRGVADDKGPSLCALYAMKFWKDKGAQFPYDIRFLFGANEETGMGDVPYYRARFADPDFLFTPDASFPVCHGEKGVYNAIMTSTPMTPGNLLELSGGMASNAVPGVARATVKASDEVLAQYFKDDLDEVFIPCETMVASNEAIGLTLIKDKGALRIEVQGKSAHASTPELGVSAIYLLIAFLLSQNLLAPDEANFLQIVNALSSDSKGAGVGLDCSDEHFGDLSLVAGVIAMKTTEEGVLISQTIDSRFPTSVTSGVITDTLKRYAAKCSASVVETHVMEPFLMDSDSSVIQALLSAYNEVTGENRTSFTMGGATYAREFTTAASFGPEKPWAEKPAWVGSMHGPDEGMKEEDLKEAMKIYILTLEKLMKLEF